MRDEDFFYEGAERGDLLDALNGHAHDGATTVLEGEAGIANGQACVLYDAPGN